MYIKYIIVYINIFFITFGTYSNFLMNRLANTIHVERAKTRMTQQELAEKVNVTRQTIHSIEKGKKIPSVQLALEIANVFNVSIEKIFLLNPQN